MKDRATTRYAIMDVETTRLRHGEFPTTKFWGFADASGYKYFPNSNKFCEFLRRDCEPAIVMHHFNFDVIQLLLDGAVVRVIKSHNGRLILCKYGNHLFLNSGSVFPISLKQVFAAFGYKKTELACPAHTIKANDSEETRLKKLFDGDSCLACNQLLRKRNYDDCVIGLECFLKLDAIFFDLVGISPLSRHTIASTGFAAAEKIAGKMPKDLRFLESYRGGRVEVFNTNEVLANNLDINSSYPRSFMEAKSNMELWRAEVTTKDWHCPFFDANNDEMLLFPNGKFTTWIYRENFEKYIEPIMEKTKLRIISRHKIDASWLTRVAPLMKMVYDKKLASKKLNQFGVELVCKLLINACYGRIGLKGESERCRLLDYLPDGDDVNAYRINKKWLCFDKIAREPRSNYAFAAFITDNGRARLFRGFKLNDTYYGDTDSSFVKCDTGKFSEPTGEKCGEWNFKKTKSGKIKRAKFQAINVKDYSYDGEEVLKGGHEFLQWGMKQFASGKTVVAVRRTRKTGLRKRTVLNSGETVPLIVPG